MTSANQSGEPDCTNLDEIEKTCPLLNGMMEGEVSYTMGSTIVDCTSKEIKICIIKKLQTKNVNNYKISEKRIKNTKTS